MTRTIERSEEFPCSVDDLFALLVTPSAICTWWSATRAIVLPEEGGTWAAAWGEDEDAPDYVTTARMVVFDPPRRLTLDDYRYASKAGPMPFEADFRTTFSVEAAEAGARLTVEQEGFPDGPEADEFHAGCVEGWRNTFAGIRSFLERS